jgi:hypothetical protein
LLHKLRMLKFATATGSHGRGLGRLLATGNRVRIPTIKTASNDRLKPIFRGWRRERDSNPRGDFRPPIDLANRPLQPLGYLSLWRKGWDSNPRSFRLVVFKTTALDQLCDPSVTQVSISRNPLASLVCYNKRNYYGLRTKTWMGI